MDSNDIIHLINNNDFLSNDNTISQLENLVDSYPYFQTARLLLTKGLYITDQEKYDKTLPCTAALCADRESLFFLINSEKFKPFLIKPESSNIDDKTENILDSYFAKFYSDDSETESHEETIISTDYITYLQHNETNREREEESPSVQNRLKHQDIIDSFLKKAETNDISLPPLSKETKKTSNSEIETSGGSFLTETLAKIYIKQKKYEQALTIIQQLSLNFPKKSAYFADQIRFLELLIINEKNKK